MQRDRKYGEWGRSRNFAKEKYYKIEKDFLKTMSGNFSDKTYVLHNFF